MNLKGEGRQVFVVEDDTKIANVLRDYLTASGYDPVLFRDGAAAISAARENPPSAIILDIMLPGMDGHAICRKLRQFSPVPIIMLTARIAEDDRLSGLRTGADDYVCKPFSPREVIARIDGLIRRAEGRVVEAQTENLPYYVDDQSRRIAWKGSWLDLSHAQFTIAAALMNQPGRIFSRDQLLDRLGERSQESSDRAIDSHMKNIRRKFSQSGADANCFVSVYGAGYRFDPEPKR